MAYRIEVPAALDALAVRVARIEGAPVRDALAARAAHIDTTLFYGSLAHRVTADVRVPQGAAAGGGRGGAGSALNRGLN
jgi:hypothetical protein